MDEPGIVRKLKEHAASIEYNSIVKTADTHRVLRALATRQTKDVESMDEDISDKPTATINAINTSTSSARIHKRRTQAQVLSKENCALMAALPGKRIS